MAASSQPQVEDQTRTAAVVAQLRWLGVALGIVQALVTIPPPVSRPAVIGLSLLLAAYNVPAALIRRMPPRVVRVLVPTTLVADFLVCTAFVLLLANDEFGTAYVIYALVAIEAAVLYRWKGTLVFIAGLVAAMVAFYFIRAAAFGFDIQPGSALFRISIIALIALMSGGITSAAEASAREARREAERSAALATVASQLSETLRLEQALKTLMDVLATIFPDRWHGLLLDTEAGTLELAHVRGDPSDLTLAWVATPVPEGGSGYVLLDNLAGNPELEAVGAELAPELGDYQSGAVFELRGRGRSYGVLVSLDRSRSAFTADDIRFMGPLAQETSIGLENARLFDDVELLSLTDQTTELFNRRAFDTRIEEEFYRAQRYELPLSILMIDVDHFKRYNDAQGHLAGDEVLRRIGQVLATEALRRVDSAFRYGGEEFAVLMPMTNVDQAALAATRIRELVAAKSFAGGGDQPGGRITVSVGVAGYPDHGTTADELLDRADRALYDAKHEGRDRIALYQARPPKSVAKG